MENLSAEYPVEVLLGTGKCMSMSVMNVSYAQNKLGG